MAKVKHNLKNQKQNRNRRDNYLKEKNSNQNWRKYKSFQNLSQQNVNISRIKIDIIMYYSYQSNAGLLFVGY